MKVDSRLARELIVTANHEAGHAVAAIRLGLPVHDASISVVRDGWFRPPNVNGLVRHSPNDNGGWVPSALDRTDEAVFGLAGPEAEAQWHHREQGVRLGRARGDAWEQSAACDIADVHAMLGGDGRAVRKAEQAAIRLVSRYWGAIEAVGVALLETRCLSGTEIRRIVRGCRA